MTNKNIGGALVVASMILAIGSPAAFLIATHPSDNNISDKEVVATTSYSETTTGTTEATTDTTTSTTETTVTTESSTTTDATTVVFTTCAPKTRPVETTRATTTTATETTTATISETDISTETVETETVTETTEPAVNEQFIGTFTRGTYYTFGTRGGSGRKLVSGYSIASRALYEMYGYGDFKIRIECDEFPALNGVYSLDDCSAKGDNRVIDFWFSPGNVPAYFANKGVLKVRAYIIYN